jgi:hypothetical protein
MLQWPKRCLGARFKKSSSQKPILSKWPKVTNLTVSPYLGNGGMVIQGLSFVKQRRRFGGDGIGADGAGIVYDGWGVQC